MKMAMHAKMNLQQTITYKLLHIKINKCVFMLQCVKKKIIASELIGAVLHIMSHFRLSKA